MFDPETPGAIVMCGQGLDSECGTGGTKGKAC